MPKLDRLQRRWNRPLGGAAHARAAAPRARSRPRYALDLIFVARRRDVTRRRRRRCAGGAGRASWVAAVPALVRRRARRGARRWLRRPPSLLALAVRWPAWRVAAGSRERARCCAAAPATSARGSGWSSPWPSASACPWPGRAPPATSPPTARSPGSWPCTCATGVEHHVFVPHVPYSGSLKSHLTAPAGRRRSIPRAPSRSSPSSSMRRSWPPSTAWPRPRRRPARSDRALAAGLYAGVRARLRHPLQPEQRRQLRRGAGPRDLGARAGPALGGRRRARRHAWPLAMGLLLGLAFWCHILAVIHVAAVGLCCSSRPRRARARRRARALAAGFALGDLPGLLWNAANGWESFRYLVPGGDAVGAGRGPGLAPRPRGRARVDQLPVLLGYDLGYPARLDVAAARRWRVVALRRAGRGGRWPRGRAARRRTAPRRGAAPVSPPSTSRVAVLRAAATSPATRATCCS